MGTSLGGTLKELREIQGLTLRELEQRTGLSSGYLSLLEHDKVKHPNPGVLYRLANALGGTYADLMQRAGYPVLQNHQGSDQRTRPAVAFKGAEQLTKQQRQEVQDFIYFKLRQQLRHNPDENPE